jgi:hypothetical protein
MVKLTVTEETFCAKLTLATDGLKSDPFFAVSKWGVALELEHNMQ